MSELTHVSEGAAGFDRTMPIFKRLRRGELEVIHHGRHGFPGLDVYELASFDAVTSADEVSDRTPVQFYVYHTSDGSARVRNADGSTERVTVAGAADPWHLSLEDALRMTGVQYDDDTHLGDVVVDFWTALFTAPSDPFDETSYGVSPWLERNVGDRRTVRSLREGGEWDDLRLRFRPRKTFNWPPSGGGGAGDGGEPRLLELLGAVHMWLVQGDEAGAKDVALKLHRRMLEEAQTRRGTTETRELRDGVAGALGAPPGVEVLQLDLDHVGLRLLPGGPDEVPVMVLLHA